MESFTRWLGWALNLALVGMFADGLRLHFMDTPDLGIHMRLGLGVMVVAPLLYVMPYFHIIGLGGRLSQGDDDLSQRSLALVVTLKSRLFWPVLRTMLAALAGPVLGFLQANPEFPPYVHGGWMLLYMVLHLDLWARSLFALQMSTQLTQAALPQDLNPLNKA